RSSVRASASSTIFLLTCRFVPFTSRPSVRNNPTIHKHMKVSRIVPGVLLALALSATTLRAVPSLPTFSFHENGQGQLELPNGFIIPLSGTLTSDSGPGGLLSALAFTAHPQLNPLVVGDVLFLDASGHVSDILR